MRRTEIELGGTVGSIGVPVSVGQLRAVNAVGAVVIFGAALLAIPAWRRRARPRSRNPAMVIGWVAAVGCCMHALVDIPLRVLSLTGLRATTFPPGVWLSINHRVADLQDVLVNEPWFFVEGVLWAALVRVYASSRSSWHTWLRLRTGVLPMCSSCPVTTSSFARGGRIS